MLEIIDHTVTVGLIQYVNWICEYYVDLLLSLNLCVKDRVIIAGFIHSLSKSLCLASNGFF